MSEGKTLMEILSGVKSEPSGSPGKVQSAALVCNSKYGGMLVACKPGCCLEQEAGEVGTYMLDDFGLDDAPNGLSIWEGYNHWQPGGYEYPQDGEIYYIGKFRPLTTEEISTLARGESLWPELPEEPDVDEDQRAEVQGDVPPVCDEAGAETERPSG